MTRGGVGMKDNPSLRLWQLIKNSNDRQQNGGVEKGAKNLSLKTPRQRRLSLSRPCDQN